MATDSGDGGKTRTRGRLSGAPDPHGTSVLVPIVISVLVVGALAFAIVSIALPERTEGNGPTTSAPAAEPSSPALLDPEIRRAPSPVTEPSRPTEPTPQPATVSNTPLLDRSEALQALQPAEEEAKKCSDGTLPGVRVVVTFGQDGSVQEAKLIDSVEDRAELAECVLAPFRRTRIEPFRGRPLTVFRSVVFDDVE